MLSTHRHGHHKNDHHLHVQRPHEVALEDAAHEVAVGGGEEMGDAWDVAGQCGGGGDGHWHRVERGMEYGHHVKGDIALGRYAHVDAVDGGRDSRAHVIFHQSEPFDDGVGRGADVNFVGLGGGAGDHEAQFEHAVFHGEVGKRAQRDGERPVRGKMPPEKLGDVVVGHRAVCVY